MKMFCGKYTPQSGSGALLCRTSLGSSKLSMYIGVEFFVFCVVALGGHRSERSGLTQDLSSAVLDDVASFSFSIFDLLSRSPQTS